MLRFPVEVLESRALLTLDFGDAPLPFPTTLAENGAQHANIGPLMGVSRDSEIDGAHSLDANSDGSDEDGVTFGSIRVGVLAATATVVVGDAPNGATLNAWMDFNGDGNWSGQNEQIVANMAVSQGTNLITFDVPGWAKVGTCFARFRLSTTTGLGPAGSAPDGEVEDYAVSINPPAISTGIFAGQNTVTTAAAGAWNVVAADLDADGDMDILNSLSLDNKIVWYENNGSEVFTSHTIATNAYYATSLTVLDIDRDGDLDVLSALYDEVAWYENDGNQSFTAHVIINIGSPSCVSAADMDDDGDLDVLTASLYDGTTGWYENDGQQNYTAHTIVAVGTSPLSVTAADMDRDGDMDILSASRGDSKIVWYQNDGRENFTPQTIATRVEYVSSVMSADIDGDGDMDVLSSTAHDNKIAWFENDGGQNFTSYAITTDAVYASCVAAADMDGDGDMDVLSGSAGDHKTAWYENDGDRNFSFHLISTATENPHGVIAADVDGDLDVLSASSDDGRLSWYENQNPFSNDFGDAPAPYPTTFAENGAAHKAVGPMLGTTRNGEPTGAHSDNADADGDEEDGVEFGPILTGALQSKATVTVTGAVGSAKLDVWIDFNGDGNWGSMGEQIAASVMVHNGVNALTFDVPGTARSGTTFARFRLSTAGDLPVGGYAADGEVEDYAVAISPPVSATGVFLKAKTIGTATGGWQTVTSVDLDNDDDMDLLMASYADDKMTWYENIGNQSFTPHTISTAVDGAFHPIATDLDRDGDIDIVCTLLGDNAIVWFENDGNQHFATHTIYESGHPHSVVVADVDGDGDMDVVTTDYTYNEVNWYENDGEQFFAPRRIAMAAAGASCATAADVDGDGDMDIVSGSINNNRISWYENTGSYDFTTHTITASADDPQSVTAADLDGDGDMDVLSASSRDNKIAWYENDGGEHFTTHVISTVVTDAQSVETADIDGDGDLDVLSASPVDGTIVWYQNDGRGNFTNHTISKIAVGVLYVSVADIDGDGDLDVVSAPVGVGKLVWYENRNHTANDFGDAPKPYPTTLAEQGAQHPDSGPILGSTRNSESEGVHAADADADGSDDGVTFGTIQVGALNASAAVSVTGAPNGARLDAWLDFNGDGNWGGAEEHIAASVVVHNGHNELTFDVPATIKSGLTYARFRLSTEGDLGEGGWALDGEVEDYAVTISPPAAAGAAFAGEKIIAEVPGGIDVFPADIDGDGDMDVLIVSIGDGKVTWQENVGHGIFTLHAINVQGERTIRVVDADNDGDMDLLSGLTASDQIVWYENDGHQNFTARTIAQTFNGAQSALAVDMDMDGDMDILSTSGGGRIVWDENDGNQVFTAHVIAEALAGMESLAAVDMDGDGDIDVVSTSSNASTIAWYENDGSRNFTVHAVTTSANGASSVVTVDMDSDGDIDILIASTDDNKVVWYENGGSQNFAAHTITTVATYVASVTAVDVDGDGDMDVLCGSYGTDKIAWYENDGNRHFTAHSVSTTAEGLRKIVGTDIDGDGDLDILIASSSHVAWYENVFAPVLSGSGSISYTENSPATSIDAGILVTDMDSTTLVSATVKIKNYVAGKDVLNFINNVSSMGNVAIVGNTGGVLSLASAGGTATLSEWQAALRAVTYFNTSNDPDTRLRTVDFVVNDGAVASNVQSSTLGVISVADTPTVSNATTTVNTITNTGLVIQRNVGDGSDVAYFKITAITGGALYQNNGTTVINNNDFITFAQANAGLRFKPSPGSLTTGNFKTQASISNNDSGLGGGKTTATIKVTFSTPEITAPGWATTNLRPAVKWSNVPGAASYEVWITNLSTGTTPFHSATTTGVAYVPTVDLEIGQFRVWVRAKASDGTFSAWSSKSDFRIIAPVSVQSLNLVQTTPRPTLRWNPLPGAARYDVWINNISTSTRQIVRNTNVTSTSFNVPSNLPIGQYQAWVSGIAVDGMTANWSSLIEFNVYVAPSITHGQNANFDRVPLLRWNSLPGADHYDVWINNLSTGIGQVVRDVNVKTNSFSGSSPLPLGSYAAWIRGVTANGYEGAWTKGIHFNISGAPTVTQGLNSTFDRTPVFAWEALAGAVQYEVSIKNLHTGETTLNPRNINGLQFTPATNLADGAYRWWVTGVSAQGFQSQWSAPIDIYIGGRPRLLTPSGTTSTKTPTFNWQIVDGADHYDLWVNQIGGRSQIIRQQTLTGTRFTPDKALPTGTYRGWIRAVSASGELSPWSLVTELTIVYNAVGSDGLQAVPVALARTASILTEFTDAPIFADSDKLSQHNSQSGFLLRNQETTNSEITLVFARPQVPQASIDKVADSEDAAIDVVFALWRSALSIQFEMDEI